VGILGCREGLKARAVCRLVQPEGTPVTGSHMTKGIQKTTTKNRLIYFSTQRKREQFHNYRPSTELCDQPIILLRETYTVKHRACSK
jgi:hypothetical protein